jgi:hypothetical protein
MLDASRPYFRQAADALELPTVGRSTGALLSLLFLTATAAAAGPAGSDAQSSGKWVVDGNTVELGHARVFRELPWRLASQTPERWSDQSS